MGRHSSIDRTLSGTLWCRRSSIVMRSTEAAAERDGAGWPVAAESLVNPLTPKSPRSGAKRLAG